MTLTQLQMMKIALIAEKWNHSISLSTLPEAKQCTLSCAMASGSDGTLKMGQMVRKQLNAGWTKCQKFGECLKIISIPSENRLSRSGPFTGNGSLGSFCSIASGLQRTCRKSFQEHRNFVTYGTLRGGPISPSALLTTMSSM